MRMISVARGVNPLFELCIFALKIMLKLITFLKYLFLKCSIFITSYVTCFDGPMRSHYSLNSIDNNQNMRQLGLLANDRDVFPLHS